MEGVISIHKQSSHFFFPVLTLHVEKDPTLSQNIPLEVTGNEIIILKPLQVFLTLEVA